MATKKQPPKKVGRPSTFAQETADTICKRIAEGESLRAICAGEKMPSKFAVLKWLAARPEFATQYARAREEQADFYAEQIVAIADEVEVQATYQGEDVKLSVDSAAVARNRLRVDARKWVASKLAPKKYGDKVALDVKADITTHEASLDELA